MDLKVAILAGAITNKGGVERVILGQAKALNADIYVGKYRQEQTFEEFKKLKVVNLFDFPIKGKISTIKSWATFASLDLRQKYDVFIIHGAAALNAAKKNRPNIWYCHSPSRFIYDLYEHEFKKIKGLLRLPYPLVISFMRRKDQRNVKNVDKILVNSRNIKKRVKKYYNRESEVVYPFVNVKKFRFIKHGNFFLSTGRLDPIKRVHLAIRAFKKMPKKRLVIVSDGPEKKKLMSFAKGTDNIKFIGHVSEKKLQELYGKCLATIYLSYKEDFGIVPIESMAAGKPSITTKEGGFKETILHKKTGYLVNNPENTEEVIKAILWIERNYKKMKGACEKRAKIFSLKEHLKKLKKAISEVK